MPIEWVEDEDFMISHQPGGRIMRAIRRQTNNQAVEAMVFVVLMDDGKACMTYEGDWEKVETLLTSLESVGSH